MIRHDVDIERYRERGREPEFNCVGRRSIKRVVPGHRSSETFCPIQRGLHSRPRFRRERHVSDGRHRGSERGKYSQTKSFCIIAIYLQARVAREMRVAITSSPRDPNVFTCSTEQPNPKHVLLWCWNEGTRNCEFVFDKAIYLLLDCSKRFPITKKKESMELATLLGIGTEFDASCILQLAQLIFTIWQNIANRWTSFSVHSSMDGKISPSTNFTWQHSGSSWSRVQWNHDEVETYSNLSYFHRTLTE